MRIPRALLPGIAIVLVGGIGLSVKLATSDPVPTRVRDLVQQQDTLAGRIATALDADPEGWTTDGYVASWRGGGPKLWVKNGADFLGDSTSIFGTPDWPFGDHRFDADRATVWAAWQRHLGAVIDGHNAAAFASLGPAPVKPSLVTMPAPDPRPSLTCALIEGVRVCLPDPSEGR